MRSRIQLGHAFEKLRISWLIDMTISYLYRHYAVGPRLGSVFSTPLIAGCPIHAQSHRAWVGLMPPSPGTKSSAKTSANPRVKPLDPPKSTQPLQNKREKTSPQVA
jgi:hypothetical protein